MKILYEDKSLIIIEKEQGIPMQSDKTLDKSLFELVQAHVQSDYIAMINRIDRPVGGVCIFSKNLKATSILSEDIRNRKIEKIYFAVVVGVADDDAVLEDYILKNERLNKSKIVYKNSPNSKYGKLSYKKIDQIELDGKIFSLIKINLETGRHHQIRLQLSSRNIGIWGDNKYNKHMIAGNGKIGLWATDVSFIHPITKEPIHVESKIPNIEPFNYFL